MKLNITLLKNFVAELEKINSEVNTLGEDASVSEDANHKYLIAMSKCAGVCMGISQEATALVLDLQKMIKVSYLPPESEKDSPLENFFSTYLTPNKVNKN